MAAAFDTRVSGPAVFTGRAATGIAKSLHHHGLDLIVEPESFLVDKHSQLLPGERGRALLSGENLSQAIALSATAI